MFNIAVSSPADDIFPFLLAKTFKAMQQLNGIE